MLWHPLFSYTRIKSLFCNILMAGATEKQAHKKMWATHPKNKKKKKVSKHIGDPSDENA
jgi:hypothetical protein